MAVSKANKKVDLDGPYARIFRVWAWILLTWCLYRYFTHFPEAVDEFIFKPLIFLGPVLYTVLHVEKRPLSSLGFTKKNFFPSLYAGLGLGLVFAIEGLVANYVKYGSLMINPIKAFQEYGFFLIIISFATALSEEVVGRGYLFQRIYEKSKENMAYSAGLSALMFMAFHVPILLTSLKFQGTTLIMFFLTGLILSLANAIIMRYSKSIVAPVIVHALWNMTVALYL